MTELEPARTEVTFRTRSGLLMVRRRDDELRARLSRLSARARRRRDGGARRRRAARAAARGACARARCSRCSTTPPRCARSRRTSRRCRGCRPPSASPRAGDGETRPVDFVARYFAPTFGVNEDPVTGSSYCTLAPLLGGAARQAGAARAPGEPPRRRAVLRARRRSRAHRRQGAPGHHGNADVLREGGDGRLPLFVLRQTAGGGAQADLRPARLHLQRMRGALPADSSGRA